MIVLAGAFFAAPAERTSNASIAALPPLTESAHAPAAGGLGPVPSWRAPLDAHGVIILCSADWPRRQGDCAVRVALSESRGKPERARTAWRQGCLWCRLHPNRLRACGGFAVALASGESMLLRGTGAGRVDSDVPVRPDLCMRMREGAAAEPLPAPPPCICSIRDMNATASQSAGAAAPARVHRRARPGGARVSRRMVVGRTVCGANRPTPRRRALRAPCKPVKQPARLIRPFSASRQRNCRHCIVRSPLFRSITRRARRFEVSSRSDRCCRLLVVIGFHVPILSVGAADAAMQPPALVASWAAPAVAFDLPDFTALLDRAVRRSSTSCRSRREEGVPGPRGRWTRTTRTTSSSALRRDAELPGDATAAAGAAWARLHRQPGRLHRDQRARRRRRYRTRCEVTRLAESTAKVVGTDSAPTSRLSRSMRRTCRRSTWPPRPSRARRMGHRDRLLFGSRTACRRVS